MSGGLALLDLTLAFLHQGQPVAAVKACSLQVRPGEILGLLGESGSGKSLTALACLGLLPPGCRASGSVRVGEDEVIGSSEDRLALMRGRRIAMIFQNPMTALNPYFKIGSQIQGVIRQHFALGRMQARQEAIAALIQAGLTAAALDRYPHQMSGGQLQRVMIAMAIACKPAILIADEPTTALDVTVQARILRLLRALADQGMGILLISHDLGVVAKVADRVAVMYSGSIVEAGPLELVFSATGHPYTMGLMRSSPSLGQGRRKLHAIEGVVPDYRRRPSGCTFRDRCPRAQGVCTEGVMPDVEIAGGHRVRCHFPHGQALKATPA